MVQKVFTQSSLCRFTLNDEEKLSDERVKEEIRKAFQELRAFPFVVNSGIIDSLKKGADPSSLKDLFVAIRNDIFAAITDSPQAKEKIISDIRLQERILNAIITIHSAIAKGDFTSIINRRFVLIKERPAWPTLYYISPQSAVLSHVGQGPQWTEIPTIYLGLNIFNVLALDKDQKFDKAFYWLLRVEERAIETGYSHIEVYPPHVSRALNELLDEVIRIATISEVEFKEIPARKKIRAFTIRNRESFLKMLNARRDDGNFDFEKNLKAIRSLERLARRYKKGYNFNSLREIVRLLVAASGHDIHEIRNNANILLERIFAPKEFDAPLATTFVNCAAGNIHTFEFSIPEEGNYFVRIFYNAGTNPYPLEQDIAYSDIDLAFDETKGVYTAHYTFNELGHYDFLVYRKRKKRSQWVAYEGCSGRINVIPDVRGEIVLEIFPDIHGHTRIYWMDEEHPGLVYNEHGEVIRLGRFSDITAHLEDLKERYHITALYLLGVQKRGTNREDWAPEATSPSPFSPVSLVEIEDFLGGENEFRELVSKAHAMDIKIIIDVVPHLNRRSTELPDEYAVKCYDDSGNLVIRASTDGRYGSWNDGKLLNYRKLEVWEWLINSVVTLIDKYDIDGIRFDSAHAVPIMMKKNNYPFIWGQYRSLESLVEGEIIVNDREDGHFITTGYFDSACRDQIAIPFHHLLMCRIAQKLKEKNKTFFVHLAECYWGHERYLTRSGIIPYNSALFKICEGIIHGTTDVREVYHFYDNYLPYALPPGTELLGILGNHDERRALNTFGHRGLRAAIGLTIFMNNIIMDYEGSAEGESWKVFLDNIYVNWNQFEYAAHRSLESFYRQWYRFHRINKGKGYLIWANNTQVAASIKFTEHTIWIGIFNFADSSQNVALQFDNPRLPIADDTYFKVVDPVYSPITKHYSYFTGKELKASKIYSVVSYTDRIKLLKLEPVSDVAPLYSEFLRDSLFRLYSISNPENFKSNFMFLETIAHSSTFEAFLTFLKNHIIAQFYPQYKNFIEIGFKRILFYMFKFGFKSGNDIVQLIDDLAEHDDTNISDLGKSIKFHNRPGPIIFVSAEAEPFSKSGGLANVVYELPRELVSLGEEVIVITPKYRHGDEKAMEKMNNALKKYNVQYTGKNVRFMIEHATYEAGVHYAQVDGIHYYLLDHHEFFDGLYWGYTGQEKLRRRIAFARATAELITTFGLYPLFVITNDAYTGIFNGIVRSDHVYYDNPNFKRTSFFHIIHNGGWQYFDSYHRYEDGKDLFSLFNLPHWRYTDFSDPNDYNKINCMATGIRFADRVITVSPSYAKQIEKACDGLEKILHNVIGISNALGVDFKNRILMRFHNSGFIDEYYPRMVDALTSSTAMYTKITQRYPEILEGIRNCEKITDPLRREYVTHIRNKLCLQCKLGFEINPDIMLFSMIHRIAEQKGFQLLLDASYGIFTTLGFQGVIGGAVAWGDQRGSELATGLLHLQNYYPKNVNVNLGFQDISIPLLCSDVFLMPSLHEPGGISQLEALACGCLVVARATGGLRDTVIPIRMKDSSVEGNGFLFSDFTPVSFYDAMQRCAEFFRTSDDTTKALARKNAMQSVYYWDKPAKEYIDVLYSHKEIVRVV
ncbi:MAG: glycogen/starch synthase [Spirochaetota bacterium]|nr:glycogen/starch synthase [Spirochaetota bacterium]